jgi:hypothetical protein
LNDLTLRGGGSIGFSDDGGAIFNFGPGTLRLRRCTVSGNAGRQGGGVANLNGTLTLVNSIISGNTAAVAGGVFNNYGTLVLRDSTISGNSAKYDGGGRASGLNGPEFLPHGSSTLIGFLLLLSGWRAVTPCTFTCSARISSSGSRRPGTSPSRATPHSLSTDGLYKFPFLFYNESVKLAQVERRLLRSFFI